MAIDPFTGEYTSPFARGGALQGLPQFKPLPYANPPGTMLGRAIGRGVDSLQQNLGSALEGIGGSLGLDSLQSYGAGVAERNAAEVARSAALERPDSGVTGFVASTVGENAPQAGVAVGLPTLGAGIGSLAGPGGSAIGFGLGTAASALFNYLSLSGENRERQKQVNPAAPVNEAAAFGTAIPGAALETLSGVIGGKLLTGAIRGPLTPATFLSRQTAQNAAKMAGVGAVAEVPTEVGQEALTRAQAGQNLGDRDAMQAYFEAGVGAALLGGVIGGGGSAFTDYTAVRQKNAAAATNAELAGSVDTALKLGPTPPLASKLDALANPDDMLGPLGGSEAKLDRPLAKASDADLLTDIAVTEQRLAAGQATEDDARNLRLLRAERAAREAQFAQPPLPEVDPQLQMFGRGVDALVARQDAQLQAELAGGGTTIGMDVGDLEANREQSRELRAEELRQTIDRMTAEDAQRQSPMAKQETKSLKLALKALDEKAKEGPLDAADEAVKRVLSAELAAREPSEAAQQALQDEGDRQGVLFPEMAPQAVRARTEAEAREAAQVNAVKELARELGLSRNSKFSQTLTARTEEELIDTVLDNQDRRGKGEPNQKGSLDAIAAAVGVGRDFDAEIAAATAKVDSFNSRNTRTEKEAAAFKKAQRDLATLQARKEAYEAAVARKRLRDAGADGQTQLPFRDTEFGEQPPPKGEKGEKIGLLPLQTEQNVADTAARLTVQQDGQPSLFEELPLISGREQQAPPREGTPITPDNVLEAAPEPQEQLPLLPGRPGQIITDPVPQAPTGSLGERMRELGFQRGQQSIETARKDQQFAAALGQRLDQLAPAAEQQAVAPSVLPDELVSDQIKGTEAVLTFSNSAPVTLKYEKGAWYAAGKFLARKYADAKKVVIAQKTEGGTPLFLAARFISDDIVNTSGMDRLREVTDAVQKATKGWSGRNQAMVVQNFDAMPEAAKMEFRDPKVARDAAGVALGDGTVYIFADNISSRAEAVSAVFHEVLGHRGLRTAFQRDRKRLLEDMYNSNQTVRDLVQAWKDSLDPKVFDRFYGKAKLDIQVEEALAYLSEKNGPVQSTFLRRMRALFMRYANRFGWKRNFTDEEVMVMVSEAHRQAMKANVPSVRATQTAKAATPQRGTVATPAEVQAAANTYADSVTAAPMLRAAAAATNGTTENLQGHQTVVERLVRIGKLGERKLADMSWLDVKEAVRPFALGFQSMGHLAQQYGKFFPMLSGEGLQTNALKEVGRADDLRNSITQTMSRIANRIPEQVNSLSPSEQEDLFALMEATFSEIDPDKTLDQHTHLTPTRRTQLRAEFDRIQAAKNRLGRANKLQVYREARALNDATYFQQLTSDLYDLIRQNPDVQMLIPSAKDNAVLKFIEKYDIHGQPLKIREFWANQLATMVKETEAAVRILGARQVKPKDQPRINSITSGLQMQLKKTAIDLNGMKRYPYFHLGRFGKFYASFQMPRIRTADGKMIADPRAVEIVAEELHKLGLENVVVSETTEAATVFIRMDSRSMAKDVTEMALRLQSVGAVDAAKTPKYGEVDPLQVLPESARKTLDAILTEFMAANAPLDSDDEQTRVAKQAYVDRVTSDMKNAFLSRLPDASVSKVMARRGFKAGFDKDMMRSFAQRLQIASNASATRVANEIKGRATKVMVDQINQSGPQNDNKWAMTTVLREVMRREQERADTTANGFVDTMRAINHNYFLALNPGYWLTQITQLQTNVWPELVKSGVSYKRAFSAIANNFPTAFRLVRAAIRMANQQGLLKYGADATVTVDVLGQLTLDKDPVKDRALKEFVLRMFMRGSIDIGSPSRELGRAAEGRDDTKTDTAMRWASAGSFYLEMMTRLNAALAAREIAQEKGMSPDETVEYAAEVVSQAMMNYTEPNRARQFSRKGIAGQFTPLGTAFLTFQFMMLEKYSREIGTAFVDGAVTPAEKTAARRWLGAHLTAMTALAGGLGLPFVTVVARVIEGLVDLLDDDEEPYNAKAAMRNFTADIFGNDVAEVLMRGLPRAAGFDISGRIGAADILPFSKLIADRRDWDEALKDFTFRTYGAPFSMAADMATGMTKIADGQFYDGMKEMVPVALKNPMEAVKIGTKGLTDSNGNLLPIDTGTMDIIWQAMGLTPQARAEYSEANFAQAVRRSVGTREASEIRKKIVTAVQLGDRQAMRDAIAEARAFDAASPGFAILPSITSSIARAQTRMNTARATGAELGVKPTDRDALALTRFSNY